MLEKNDLEIAFTVDNAIELMNSTMWAIMDATSDDKGEFILYNTVSFLFDDGMASMEEIAKTVMLQESNIGERVTTAFATTPEYNLVRPHHLRASELINEALQTSSFEDWSTVTSGTTI